MDRETLTEPEFSALFHAFRAPRRRLVIHVLAEEPIEPLSTRQIAREIAEIEEGRPYRNVYTALSQTHLPALADPGLIIYESDRQQVAPGPHFADAVLLLTVNSGIWKALKRIRAYRS
jgi:predicted transcriptional regulator